MELLERDQYLAEFEEMLGDVVSGAGRFLIVSGEAGIGKTSLVENFVDLNKEKARVLWGACDALFTPRPLGPLYDIAYKTSSNLLALLDDEAPRATIFSAVLDEMEDSRGPTLMVIEDAHWADEATLDLVKFLGRRINRIKSMLVVTYRDDEVGAEHPLRLVLGDLPARSVRRIRLQRLSKDGVNTLADRAGRRIEDLYAVTGGNPFFVTEALASKEPGVPVTVRDAVMSRAARLSADARTALELVSVVPAKAERWLLDDTVAPDCSVLEECLDAGMLRSDGDAISFRHELARRAIEDSLAVPRRQRLHAAVLKALRDRGSDSSLARIVHHAAQAGDVASVLEYAPVAARQAAALSAHRESASHYQTALQYGDRLSLVERAELLECRSFECYLTDQADAAVDARREALQIWKQLGDKRRQGDNLRWMSRLSWTQGRKKEAEDYSIDAVTILESVTPGPELAMAYSYRAQLHMLADEYKEAGLWGSRAIELAKELGATAALVHALNTLGTAELQRNAQNEHGRIKVEESLHLALANNMHDDASRAFTQLACVSVRDRNYSLAMRSLSEGIAYSTEHGIDFFGFYMTAWRARARFEMGDWEGAADDASFVLGHSQIAAITRICALAVLGHLRVRRGDPDASRLLAEARALATETSELQRIAPVASACAEAAWLKGDLDQVINEASLVLEILKRHEEPWLKGEFSLWMLLARKPVKALGKIAAPYELQMSGHWRAAAEAWQKIGCPYEEAMALSDGDESGQRAALEILERLGAGPAAEKLRQSLRATGARGIPRGPRPTTRENPAGLTGRQMEVLSLLADGMSNPEIAERLFVSNRTVEHHVSAILAKLDARTRSEAVSLAVQAGLINQNR